MNICSFLLLSERPTCIRYVHSQHDYGGDTYPFRKTADQVPRKSIAASGAGVEKVRTCWSSDFWDPAGRRLVIIHCTVTVCTQRRSRRRGDLESCAGGAGDRSINQSINQDRVAVVCRLIHFRSHSPWDIAPPDSLLDFRSCNGGNGIQPGRSRGKLFTVWGGLMRGNPVRTTVIHLRSDLQRGGQPSSSTRGP